MGCIFWVVVWPLRRWSVDRRVGCFWYQMLARLVFSFTLSPLNQIPQKIVPRKPVFQALLSWESRLRHMCFLKITVKVSECDVSLQEDLTSTYFFNEFWDCLAFYSLAGFAQLCSLGSRLFLLIFQLMFLTFLATIKVIDAIFLYLTSSHEFQIFRCTQACVVFNIPPAHELQWISWSESQYVSTW